MKICAVQLAYADVESVADRRDRARQLVGAQTNADLVVLPELWAPGGFAYRDWPERAEGLAGPTLSAIAAAARDLGAIVHAGSIIERTDAGDLYNTSVVFGPDGQRLAVYRKIHRFGFGVGEPTMLEPGEDLVTVDLDLDGRRVRAGLATCYDARFPELFRGLLDRGVQLVVMPAAWPKPRVAAWRLFCQARAAENQCVLVGVNTAGTHAGHTMGGHSMVVAADGTILAEAGDDEAVLTVDVDLSTIDDLRTSFPVLADRRPASLFHLAE